MTTNVKTKLLFALPRVVVAGLLFGAVGKQPYDYYSVLRWVVCAAAAYFAYFASQSERQVFAYGFAAIAVLFNPLVPIHLSRSTWQPIDLLSGLFFVASLIWLQPPDPAAPWDEDELPK